MDAVVMNAASWAAAGLAAALDPATLPPTPLTPARSRHRPVEGTDFMEHGWCGACEACNPAPQVCEACSYPGGRQGEAVPWRNCRHRARMLTSLRQQAEELRCRADATFDGAARALLLDDRALVVRHIDRLEREIGEAS